MKKIPHIHPDTHEKLYTVEEFQSITTGFIDKQCGILRENLVKKRQSDKNTYA